MKYDTEADMYEYLRLKLHPTESEKYLKEVSDDKLLELIWDINEDKRGFFWRFDEQQADPVHKLVTPTDVVTEALRRKLTFTILNRS